MQNANQKGKCIKQSLPKFTTICKTYDKVQFAYADFLAGNDKIAEVKVNVPLEDESVGKFTTDFVITDINRSVSVRKCVLRGLLLKPRTVKLLDFSQRYWLQRGVTDWKVVTNCEKE